MRIEFLDRHYVKNLQRLATASLIAASIFTVVIPIASASHGGTVDFNAAIYNYDTGVLITVTDASASGFGTVTVTVTSTLDPVGITLTLTETALGTFDNFNGVTGSLLLMDGDNKFPLETTRTISFDDLTSPDDFAVQMQTIPVTSSGGNAVFVDVTETGLDTNIYEGTVTFTASPVGPTDLLISAGETFSILFPCEGASNGQITPIPAGSTLGAIRADVGDTITVTYTDPSSAVHTDTALVNVAGGCGGGGGGLIISPVIQALGALGGGTSADRTPPALTFSKTKIFSLPGLEGILESILEADPFTPLMPLDDPQFDPPLIIEDNAFVLPQYANTIPTIMHRTGDPMQLTLNLFDNTGVEHIALYTNLRENAREISDSNTYIIYDEDKPLEIVDPEGYFSNVDFKELEEGTKYQVTFEITFAKPMDTSDIIIRTWDPKRNSGDIKIFNAIKIIGEPLVKLGVNNLVQSETSTILIPYYKFPKYVIPLAGADGNIMYYNSFGGVEEKQVHPYHEPTKYPQYIGRAERHDDGFQQAIAQEDIKAQTIVQSIIGNHFTAPEDRPPHVKFFYPSKIGKLDREKEDILKDIMINEHVKATKIYSKLYHANHLED